MLTKVCVAVNLCLVCIFVANVSTTTTNSSLKDTHEEEWVVRVKGGLEVASLLALRSGYKNLGLVMGFSDTYLWHQNGKSTKSKRGSPLVKKNSKIIWADHQKVFQRHKRDFIDVYYPSDSEQPLVRDKRLFGLEITDSTERLFNDELWNEEWYLQDTRTNKDLPKLDLNVLPLYRLGVTGRGVRVAVLDDGLEYTHKDLRNNYDPTISYDVNNADNDPIPRYDITGLNGHGTRCAGEIAMEANNGKCGVGVAFESLIGGIKLLDGVINDRVEGEALGFRQDLIDIYTASWGPADDGKSLEAPGRLASEALERGAHEGRGGRGNIYVWASGNGGSKEDDCGCDGYVGSIFTIAVGSASQAGKFPWYGERCSSTLATTYSSGAYHDQMIATTDLRNKCTTRHTGTSASAPLAAGIIALALEVNKELTWRDVQHLIVETSEYSPLKSNPGWQKNSAGLWFNSRFGFGLMNAYSLVSTAYNWTRVPPKIICQIKSLSGHRSLAFGKPKTFVFNAVACPSSEAEVVFLEHVQLEMTVQYTIRGALQMQLTSATGTKTTLLNPRRLDDSSAGFKSWKFMSVATWGEDPRGKWCLEIKDEVGPNTNNGSVEEVTLILHGTTQPPAHRSAGSRIYNDDYNRLRKTSQIETILANEIAGKREWDVKDNKINLDEEASALDWLRRLLFG